MSNTFRTASNPRGPQDITDIFQQCRDFQFPNCLAEEMDLWCKLAPNYIKEEGVLKGEFHKQMAGFNQLSAQWNKEVNAIKGPSGPGHEVLTYKNVGQCKAFAELRAQQRFEDRNRARQQAQLEAGGADLDALAVRRFPI